MGKNLGSPNAPVTLQSVQRFRMSPAKHLHDHTLQKAALADSIKNGKVQLVRRDFRSPA